MNLVTVRRLSGDNGADSDSWVAVRNLCCRTGNNGDAIAPERWELFSRIWVEPYEKIIPQWTYLAESGDVVVGYLTGCPDSPAFYRMKRWQVTFPLIMAIAGGQYRRVPGGREFVRHALGLGKSPERRFTPALRRVLARDYPAHLHVNVAAGYRQRGIGRLLIQRYFADLRRQRIAGVHLFCGARPLAFYRRIGLRTLDSVELPGGPVFVLGARL